MHGGAQYPLANWASSQQLSEPVPSLHTPSPCLGSFVLWLPGRGLWEKRATVYVEVKGQLSGVSSLLPLWSQEVKL